MGDRHREAAGEAPPASPGAELIRDAAAGDADALAAIMALHDASMRRICMVVTGNAALVEEAVQAAWVRAWRHLGSLRDPDRLRPWLMSVAANEARQQVRAAYRRTAHERRTDVSRRGTDPAARAELVDLAAAVGRLDTDERRLLALRYVADLTSEEIGRELGMTAAAVRGRLARIVERLRRELA
ncbi:MAG TPA: sigma-70 family RNA polymerase sigma factor [candidate division Zixibacteria bacterium]|nr:sigma-70 family RNA polymerase sigma factor [candidate division Zixibacteria bacterium]